MESKILEFNSLNELKSAHPDKRIVHCHGVFDLIHAGHLAYFKSAKEFGDLLVVTLTANEFVNKGPGRPYFNSGIRANMVAALELVDYVAISRFPTAVPAIECLKPHFYVKGPDYRNKSEDPTGAIYDEEKAVEKNGGKLVFTEDETHSSSNLLNQFFSNWSDDQKVCMNEVKKAGGLDKILSLVNDMKDLKVLIVGEPIIDTYVFCKPEAISSKSPSISAKFLYEEHYAGGSLAIANHLAGFSKNVSLLLTHGGEPHFKKILKQKLNPSVRLIDTEIENFATPQKTRFIADDKVQRMFELTKLTSDQWMRFNPDAFIDRLKTAQKDVDLVILADFGHGLFEGKVLSEVNALDKFVALNVQTNSSNFGFNPFTKHTNYSFLSMDLKEARIAYHDRFSSEKDLCFKIWNDLKEKNLSLTVTLGPNGSYYFQNQGSETEFVHTPAFTDRVIDPVGAGDAFFGITSMLTCLKAPPIIASFMGNVFAGLKTKIIGNKSAVDKAQYIKAMTSILK